MRVLAIDTVGPVIGVALVVDGRCEVRTERIARGAESRLMPWATELCAGAGVVLADLDGVAVSRGPGAFTGLRVGLAAALGVAWAAGCPVWACDSLLPRAQVGRTPGVPLLVALDARKSRVYAALYGDDGVVEPAADVAPEVAAGWSEGPFEATGEGSAVYADVIGAAGGRVLPDPTDPCVGALAALGAAAIGRGEGVDPATVQPLYLRQPDAKLPKRG